MLYSLWLLNLAENNGLLNYFDSINYLQKTHTQVGKNPSISGYNFGQMNTSRGGKSIQTSLELF